MVTKSVEGYEKFLPDYLIHKDKIKFITATRLEPIQVTGKQDTYNLSQTEIYYDQYCIVFITTYKGYPIVSTQIKWSDVQTVLVRKNLLTTQVLVKGKDVSEELVIKNMANKSLLEDFLMQSEVYLKLRVVK